MHTLYFNEISQRLLVSAVSAQAYDAETFTMQFNEQAPVDQESFLHLATSLFEEAGMRLYEKTSEAFFGSFSPAELLLRYPNLQTVGACLAYFYVQRLKHEGFDLNIIADSVDSSLLSGEASIQAWAQALGILLNYVSAPVVLH